MDRGHGRRGLARAARRLPRRACAPRARPSRSCAASPTSMLEHAHRIDVPGPDDRHRRHRRRPDAHREHLDDGGHRRRRRRRCASSSTATARRPRARAPPTSWRRSASSLDPLARRRWPRWPSEAGITFCFAPAFHPSMRHAGGRPRATWASATAFNVLGPLTNPAQPTYAAVGCRRRADRAAAWPGCSPAAAARRPSSAATTGWTSSPWPRRRTVWWVRDGAVTELIARPARTSGSTAARSRPCAAGTPRTTPRSSATCWPVSRGPVRDAVVLNARHRARDRVRRWWGDAVAGAAGDGGARGHGACRRRDRLRRDARRLLERWVERHAARRRAEPRAAPPSRPLRARRRLRVAQSSRPRLKAASRSCAE